MVAQQAPSFLSSSQQSSSGPWTQLPPPVLPMAISSSSASSNITLPAAPSPAMLMPTPTLQMPSVPPHNLLQPPPAPLTMHSLGLPPPPLSKEATQILPPTTLLQPATLLSSATLLPPTTLLPPPLMQGAPSMLSHMPTNAVGITPSLSMTAAAIK